MNYTIDSVTILIAVGLGIFPGSLIGFLIALAVMKGRELRAANEAWRQATTFHTHKNGNPATRL